MKGDALSSCVYILGSHADEELYTSRTWRTSMNHGHEPVLDRAKSLYFSLNPSSMRLLPGAQVLRVLIFSSTLCCAHTRTTKRPTVGATWSSLPGDRRGSKHGSGPVLVVS